MKNDLELWIFLCYHEYILYDNSGELIFIFVSRRSSCCDCLYRRCHCHPRLFTSLNFEDFDIIITCTIFAFHISGIFISLGLVTLKSDYVIISPINNTIYLITLKCNTWAPFGCGSPKLWSHQFEPILSKVFISHVELLWHQTWDEHKFCDIKLVVNTNMSNLSLWKWSEKFPRSYSIFIYQNSILSVKVLYNMFTVIREYWPPKAKTFSFIMWRTKVMT